MKAHKFLILLCVATLFSCKENKLSAQKTQTLQKGVIEKIAIDDFKSKIEFETVQLIDVRTPGEYEEGYIAYAKNVNFYDVDFLTQLEKLDKNEPVYLYCKSGGRSGKASRQLLDAGFSVVYDLKGGFSGWKSAGLPFKK